MNERLTMKRLKILIALSREIFPSVSELARHLEMDRGNLQRELRWMRAENWVALKLAKPNRSVPALTQKGGSVLARFRSEVAA